MDIFTHNIHQILLLIQLVWIWSRDWIRLDKSVVEKLLLVWIIMQQYGMKGAEERGKLFPLDHVVRGIRQSLSQHGDGMMVLASRLS